MGFSKLEKLRPVDICGLYSHLADFETVRALAYKRKIDKMLSIQMILRTAAITPWPLER